MDTCVCVVEIYRLSLSFPRSLAHVDVLVHVRGRGAGMTTQGCGVWVKHGIRIRKSSSATSSTLASHRRRRCGEPESRVSAPRRSGARDAATVDSRTRQVTGAPPHLSCRIVRFRSDLRLPHAALATARLVALFHFAPVVARWPPRLVAAPTTVRTTLGQRTTRPAHESRQPAPPTGAASATPSFCTRHCGATTDALRSPLQPCPGRSRRVRAVRGPYCVLGDGR